MLPLWRLPITDFTFFFGNPCKGSTKLSLVSDYRLHKLKIEKRKTVSVIRSGFTNYAAKFWQSTSGFAADLPYTSAHLHSTSALEVVLGAGFEIIFYPKYHCELNFIEMLWGWIKSYHRRTCTYVYKDLKDALPTTLLETMPLAFVRRASRYCFRFMSGYREGLQGPLLDFSMKKYSSHRSIPAGVIDILQADFNQHLKKKSNNKSSSK